MRSSSQLSSPLGVKVIALVMVFGLAFYLLAPPSSWKRVVETPVSIASGIDECPPCACECAESESLLLPGMVNTPSTDCEKLDFSVKEDTDQSSVELLSEELKLQEKLSEEKQTEADAALLEAKKLTSQYQKEAEKCSSGMETCEQAREKSEAALAAQKKVSAMWERRARELGWRDRAERQSIFSRMGFTGSTTEEGEGDSFFQ